MGVLGEGIIGKGLMDFDGLASVGEFVNVNRHRAVLRSPKSRV
jgi:hypothetical protein